MSASTALLVTSSYPHFYTDAWVSGVTYSTTPSTIPTAPTALAATSVTATGFTANWSTSTGATGYYLDVSTSSSFASFVFVGQNVSVGNVTNYTVAGLKPGITYYYRVRASNSAGASGNSNSMSATDLYGFLLTPSTGQTVAAGNPAMYTITVTPNPAPFNYPVEFRCDGVLPTGVTCSSFSPASVTPGSSNATATLTLSTTSHFKAANHASSNPSMAGLSIGAFVLLVLSLSLNRKRLRLLSVLLLFGLLTTTGCGANASLSASNPIGTPAGTYEITVLATGNEITQATTVSLIVE